MGKEGHDALADAHLAGRRLARVAALGFAQVHGLIKRLRWRTMERTAEKDMAAVPGQGFREATCKVRGWLPPILGGMLFLMTACAADPAANNTPQPRKYHCDRNGIYEERTACKT